MKMEKMVNCLWRLWWIALAIGILVMCISGVARAEQYAMTTVVVDIADDNTVICLDFDGNEWAFIDDGWKIGDVCSMLMDDRETETLYDDMILEYRCDGWLENWMERVFN